MQVFENLASNHLLYRYGISGLPVVASKNGLVKLRMMADVNLF